MPCKVTYKLPKKLDFMTIVDISENIFFKSIYMYINDLKNIEMSNQAYLAIVLFYKYNESN